MPKDINGHKLSNGDIVGVLFRISAIREDESHCSVEAIHPLTKEFTGMTISIPTKDLVKVIPPEPMPPVATAPPGVQMQHADYPCGCSADSYGPDPLPNYCPQHGTYQDPAKDGPVTIQ